MMNTSYTKAEHAPLQEQVARLSNHGRAAEPQVWAELGRVQLPAAADFLLRRGFIVAVPTRIGYGVTGGEDLENSGACDNKNYPPAFAAAAQQTVAVIDAMRQRPDTAKDQTVVVGQSFGGAAAVAVEALNPPGVQATINFAGGGGGNPRASPQRPCAPHLLEKMFKHFGRTARVPSLWIYTENDKTFGPQYPRDWFAAYVAAGGKAQWVQFAPHGADGHSLFTRFPQVWQPAVGVFLDAQGFKPTAGND